MGGVKSLYEVVVHLAMEVACLTLLSRAILVLDLKALSKIKNFIHSGEQYMNKVSPISCLLGLALMLTGSASADAQTSVAKKTEARIIAAIGKIQKACNAELTSYCSSVTPGEGRLIFCMLAHEDKISTKCDYALYSARRDAGQTLDRVLQAADACWPDIEKHCATIPEGGGRIAQCLVDNKAKLKKACQTALAKIPMTK